jgi:hypothetical protein
MWLKSCFDFKASIYKEITGSNYVWMWTVKLKVTVVTFPGSANLTTSPQKYYHSTFRK